MHYPVIGTTSAGAVKKLLRVTSRGLAGTMANIHHHAENLYPLVTRLAVLIDKLDIKEWRQGHNMHVLVTHDDRLFSLKPVRFRERYVGVQLSLLTINGHLKPRHSHPLINITHVDQITPLYAFMRILVTPMDYDRVNEITDENCMADFRAV